METIPVRQLYELQKLDEHPAASTPRPISRADLVTLLNRYAPDPDSRPISRRSRGILTRDR